MLRGLAPELANTAEALFLLGLACFQQDKAADASACFLALLRQVPDHAEACFYLAGLAVNRGDTAAAIGWLDKYVALVPGDVQGWLYLGIQLLARPDFPRAVEALEQAATCDPSSEEVRRYLGGAYFNTQKYGQALATLEPLTRTENAGAELLRPLCVAAREVGDHGQSVRFAEMLAARPDSDAEALQTLAACRFRVGDEGAAIADYQRYLERAGVAADGRRVLATRIVTTEAWEFLASRWVAVGIATESPRGSIIRPSLTRHDQALVIAPEWLAITRDGDILIDQMVHNPVTLRRGTMHVKAATDSRCLMDLPAETTDIVEACALIGGTGNYYHWLVDHLPRLGMLRRRKDLRDLKLLVNSDLARHQLESLAALGIGEDQLIRLAPDSMAKCRVLWVPTLMSHITALHRYVAGFLRITFLKPEMAQAPRRRLYVSRADASQRRLVNEAEITARLQQQGFEVIVPGQLSFRDQVATFAAAEMIVGPHGAGLANMLFAPDDVKIVELGYPQYPSTSFSSIASLLGQTYLRIDGEVAAMSSPMQRTWDFRIDAERVAQAVAKRSD